MDTRLSDLIPGLMAPLWEGIDDEFAAYVHDAIGIPATLRTVSITPQTAGGRTAVAIGSQEGAIVFVIEPGGSDKARISPFVMGPFVTDLALCARAQASDIRANAAALASLLLRRLGPEAAVAIMTPEQTH